INLSTPDVLATRAIKVPNTGSAGADVSTVLGATLQPGWYALGFGTGAFGAAIGNVSTIALTTDLAPTLMTYAQFQSNHFAHPNERNYYTQAIRFFVANSPPSGDFNLSGYTDAADLAIWRSAFGVNGQADADRDGDSDGTDFLKWQRDFSPAPIIANGDFE